MFDVLVRGGHVVDPARGWDAVLDVGIVGGRIAAVGPDLGPRGVRGELIDASGLLVTPGWVDLHTHLYWGVAPLGVDADTHCLRRGVTTAVDAGSAGASTFAGFKRYVIDVSATRVVALLHISSLGMARDESAGDGAVGELEDIRWANVDRAVEMARAYADVIRGIKVRISTYHVGEDPERAREALRRARRAADAIGKPVMVHPGQTTISLDEVLDSLVRGDVVTHVYHGRSEGVLDTSGTVRACVRAAVERGVHFDVGHGRGSFSWDVARKALRQGLLPSTISSDVHAWNVAGPVFDLATTASKLLHLGLSVPEVIRRVTSTPAACAGLDDDLGTLVPGARADLSLFRLREGAWSLRDSAGQEEIAQTRFEPVLVVRDGQPYACSPTAGT